MLNVVLYNDSSTYVLVFPDSQQDSTIHCGCVTNYKTSVTNYITSVTNYITSVTNYITSVTNYITSVTNYITSVTYYITSVTTKQRLEYIGDKSESKHNGYHSTWITDWSGM